MPTTILPPILPKRFADFGNLFIDRQSVTRRATIPWSDFGARGRRGVPPDFRRRTAAGAMRAAGSAILVMLAGYAQCFAPPPMTCFNTCKFGSDSYCDDGGSGAEYSACGICTDCVDCGPRQSSLCVHLPPSNSCPIPKAA